MKLYTSSNINQNMIMQKSTKIYSFLGPFTKVLFFADFVNTIIESAYISFKNEPLKMSFLHNAQLSSLLKFSLYIIYKLYWRLNFYEKDWPISTK